MTVIDWLVPLFTLVVAVCILRYWKAVDATIDADAPPDPVLLAALQRRGVAAIPPTARPQFERWPA